MTIFPAALQEFFLANQEVLWFFTLCVDLGCTVLMYRIFGRQGLVAAIILSILLANLQGPKLTVIFGLQTSLGVIFYSSIFFATDLLSEKYGRDEANKAVRVGFAVSLILVVMMSIALLFKPSEQPESAVFSAEIQSAFEAILDFTPRFVFGSLLAYLVSQSFDVWAFHAIKKVDQRPPPLAAEQWLDDGLANHRHPALFLRGLVGSRRSADGHRAGHREVWFQDIHRGLRHAFHLLGTELASGR